MRHQAFVEQPEKHGEALGDLLDGARAEAGAGRDVAASACTRRPLGAADRHQTLARLPTQPERHRVVTPGDRTDAEAAGDEHLAEDSIPGFRRASNG